MADPQTVTITTASNVTYTSYTEVQLPNGVDGPSSETSIGAQAIRVTADIDTVGGTAANLRFVLRDSSKVYAYADATLTVTAVRTGVDGVSGNYRMTVVFVESGTSWLDVKGYNNQQGKKWYVGLAGAFGGSAASLVLDIFHTRSI